MDANDWIAEQTFRCIAPEGAAFSVTIRIGLPKREAVEGEQHHEYASCSVALEPLGQDRQIPGANAFQALCLAIEYVRTVFKVFTAEGGRVYWEDTESHVNIASPWFAPLPRLSEVLSKPAPPSAGDA